MGMTRRGFLLGTGGVVLTAGCATTVSGTPAADPRATPTRDAPTSSKPSRPRESDTVKIGVLAYPPYTVEEGGELTGPVPDVAKAVLANLDMEVEFTRIQQWEQLMVMIQAGRLDLGAGLGVSPERCTRFQFSEPDHVSGTAFAVPAGNPKGLKIFADIVAKDAKVGVLENAPEATDATKAGVPATNVVAIPDPAALLAAIRQGEIDCFAFDEITLRDMVRKQGDGLEVAPPFLPDDRLPFVGAYAFPEDSDLVESFNEELAKLHESGEWLRMVEPFGFTEDNAPPPDLTTESLCGGR